MLDECRSVFLHEVEAASMDSSGDAPTLVERIEQLWAALYMRASLNI